MPGFWSSNLFADITLVVQILFFLLLSAGVIAQLQKKYKAHDRIQIPVVVLNIFFIVLVMMPTFRFVVGDLPAGLSRVPTWVTLAHALLGVVAQLLALYCLLAGIKVLPRNIGTLRYWMWATYAAWTAAVVFGIGVYVTFYLAPVSAATQSIAAGQDTGLVEEHAEPVADAPTAVPEEAAPETVQAEPMEGAESETDEAGPVEEPEPEAVESEHAAEAVPEAVGEATEIEPSPQAVSEPAEEDPVSEQPETVESEPMLDTGTFAMDDLIDEHVGEVSEIAEPEFSGEVLQAEWTPVQTTNSGPSARYEHAMHYNPLTNQVFVYGGRDGSQIFDEVWALDVETLTWRQIAASAPVAPPARYSSVVASDETGETLYVATGQTQGGKNFDDIWKLDLATENWTDLTGTAGQSPEPRYGAPGGSLAGNLITTHGFGGTRYDDTWRFNTVTEQWENVTPGGPVPLRRCLFAAAPSDTSLVIHGGCASGFGDCFLDDTWLLDTTANAWREVLSDVKPVGRQYQSLVSTGDGTNRVILFAGQDATRAPREDLWSLDLGTGVWQPVETSGQPGARYQHAAVWIPGRGMLVFGGRNNGALGDLWLLEL